jgi:hypothetical protein
MSKFLKHLSIDQFNAKYPVGSKFVYYPIKGDLDGWFRVETRSEAWALGHGATVVLVTNVTGCVDIRHLKPLEGN